MEEGVRVPPLLSFVDHRGSSGGEPAAQLLRPSKAGSNTAADHIVVLDAALAQLPGALRARDETGRVAVIPAAAWTPAYPARRPRAAEHRVQIEPRDGTWVAEATGLIELRGWPGRTRLILRKERPHPGAQLRTTDPDGLRITGFLTTPGGPARQLPDLELRHRRPPRPARLGANVDIRAPKYGSERTVYLADGLVGIIAEHLGRLPGDGATRWIFYGEHGNPPHQNTVGYWWRKTRTAAGCPTIKLHDLRHFYASGLIAAGCDVVTVQRAMGHGSATVTLNTYAHLWPSAADRTRAAAAGMLAAVLHGNADEPLTNDAAA